MYDSAPAPFIESRILLIRGHKVLLDRDLAQLYQVKATDEDKYASYFF